MKSKKVKKQRLLYVAAQTDNRSWVIVAARAVPEICSGPNRSAMANILELNSHIFIVNKTITIIMLVYQVRLAVIGLPSADSTRQHIQICWSCSSSPPESWKHACAHCNFGSKTYRNRVLLQM